VTENTEMSVHETMIVHRQKKLDEIIGRETLCICGSPRGMTSLVAWSLYNMGYFLGEALGLDNHEDFEFMEAIPDPSQQKHSLLDGALPGLIEKRNGTHERWGFKLPRAAFHAQELDTLLRNPVWVVCVRNPVAVAKSVLARDKNKSMDLRGLMAVARIPYKAIDAVTAKTDSPLIIIDMDQVNRKPASFVSELGSILDLQGDFSEIWKILSSSGYKRSQPRDATRFLTRSQFLKSLETPA